MEDIEQAAKALERVEVDLLLWAQGARPRFCGEFVHQCLITGRKPEAEERMSGIGRKVSLKVKDWEPPVRL
jgi:hypothetical protein